MTRRNNKRGLCQIALRKVRATMTVVRAQHMRSKCNRAPEARRVRDRNFFTKVTKSMTKTRQGKRGVKSEETRQW